MDREYLCIHYDLQPHRTSEMCPDRRRKAMQASEEQRLIQLRAKRASLRRWRQRRQPSAAQA